jgi:CAAX prenyl protease-like protein
MLAGGIEPSPPEPIPAEKLETLSPETRERMAEGTANRFGFRYKDYPIAYTIKIALTIAAILFVLPGYRQFPFHISPLAVGVGVVGVVIWIVLCKLHFEKMILGPLGLSSFLGLGERPAYNPLEQLRDTPAWAYTFLAIRFLGLALIVPIIEEFFLRGFLMRFVVDERWWEVPFGNVTRNAAIAGTVFPMLMHPAELLAAAAWFSLVTWLMIRTRNIWDCVAAHAVTNFLLGVYVVTQGQWQLW